MKPTILWLHSDRMGCGSYRCYTPALTLEEEGTFHNRMLLHDEVTPLTMQQLEGADLVVFQRAVSPVFKAWMVAARKQGAQIVFETDDHLFRIPKHNPASAHWGEKSTRKLLRWEIEFADHVICSTPPLAEEVLEHTAISPAKVTVCYNHLHEAIWGDGSVNHGHRYDNQSKVVIGYQGSATHNADFTAALPALKRLLDTHPHVLLRFFGYVPPAIRDVIPLARWQWAKGVPFDQYPAKLAYMNFDIGIAPLLDSKFNRAKSNLKFLEYSALGVPSVCSPVYPYATTVRHGETGFLAGSEAEWFEHLDTLVRDADLRAKIGAQAKTAVWQEWSAAQRMRPWRSVFQSLVRQGVPV